MLTIGVGAVLAASYVDDVYVWVPKTNALTVQPEVTTGSAEATDTVVQPEAATAFTIEFLDDSITRQNPDTVVRAIIRR